jgi:hypothetical protein
MKHRSAGRSVSVASVKSNVDDRSRGDRPQIVDPQKAFEHLHKELVEYQLRFVENGIKAATLALLMIGWILTSESARSFIKVSRVGRSAVVVGVGLMIVAYLLLAVRMIQVMQHLNRQLKALDYFPPAYYAFRVMTPVIAVANAALGIAPAAVVIALILFGVK